MPSSPISSPTPAPEFKPSPWNLLVIFLVAVCCAVFIFLSYFNTLKRLCYVLFGVSVPTNQDRRQLLNEAGLDDPSLNIHSHGLGTSIVNSLPITQFKKKEEEGKGSCNSECAVCLGEFEEGEWLKHLPNCCHAFHISCIDTWFRTHSSCPLCRSNVSDVTLTHECSVSMYTLLESLRREDFFPERSAHFQMVRTSVLQNQALRYESSGSGNN